MCLGDGIIKVSCNYEIMDLDLWVTELNNVLCICNLNIFAVVWVHKEVMYCKNEPVFVKCSGLHKSIDTLAINE